MTSLSQRYVHSHAQRSIIHNGKYMEQVSTGRWTDKGILLSYKRKEILPFVTTRPTQTSSGLQGTRTEQEE